jgi:hypothetical protein
MHRLTIRRARIAACAGLAAIASAVAIAADVPKPGTVLQATADVRLRDAPPEQRLGLFVDSPGPQIHTISAGEQVKVQAVDTVKVPFDQHIWVQVQTLKGDKGWAYFGSDGSSQNFRVK